MQTPAACTAGTAGLSIQGAGDINSHRTYRRNPAHAHAHAATELQSVTVPRSALTVKHGQRPLGANQVIVFHARHQQMSTADNIALLIFLGNGFIAITAHTGVAAREKTHRYRQLVRIVHLGRSGLDAKKETAAERSV